MELILLDELRLQPWLGKSGWGVGSHEEEADEDERRSVPSLPGLDPLVMLTRHFRAGLLIVPSLRDLVRALTSLSIESWKTLIWTSLKFSRPCGTEFGNPLTRR